MRKAFERDGYQAQEYIQAQEAILNELMGVRFTAKMVEKLADTLREQVAEVRKLERAVLHSCVDRAGMPRAYFIKAFPGNETNLNRSEEHTSELQSLMRISYAVFCLIN